MTTHLARKALIIFTLVNLLNYIDRFIFSALLPAIQRDLGFSDTQLGALGSAFIFAYVLLSPLFGILGDRANRNKLMALGVGLWSAATAFTGVAHTFLGQAAARIGVGVGEASYSVISPSSIADHYPPEKRGKAFAIYAGAIPVGSALGYLLGGVLEAHFGWEKAFFVVGMPGLVLAAILYFLKEPVRGGSENEVAQEWKGIKSVLSELGVNGAYVSIVVGYTAYTFVVGGMAFWMPSYIVRYFEISLEKGNIIFGGITVAGGFLGTLIGGWWSDRIESRSGNGHLKICVGAVLLSVPLFLLVLDQTNFTAFCVLLFFLEVFLFMCISPIESVAVNVVRPHIRATSTAVNVFTIHCFGDGISRILIGSVSDQGGLKSAIGFCAWVLALGGLTWGYGLVRHWQPRPWPMSAAQLPWMQRHRGRWRDSGLRENSLDAFRLAKSQGSTMIELDIQLSKDKVAVVNHDLTLKRLQGLDEKVANLTANELWTRAQVPSLVVVLKDPACPPMVNIEIKGHNFWNIGLEKAVTEAIIEANAQSRVIVSSFNPFSLMRMAKLMPSIPRAYLVTEEKSANNPIYLRKMWFAFLTQPQMLNLDNKMVTHSRMREFKRRKIPVYVWTVNDATRAAQLKEFGVSGLISDIL